MIPQVSLRRAYEAPGPHDGYRVLVDRLWPRGVSRESLHLDDWVREVAPSAELRTWYGHHAERWAEFRSRYLAELIHGQSRPALDTLADSAGQRQVVTLVFGARDVDHSHAAVLRDVLEFALQVALPPPRQGMLRAREEFGEKELLDLERLARERLAVRPAAPLVADVAVLAFLPAYIDSRTVGLCHDGALEVFGEALREAIRPTAIQSTDRQPRIGEAPSIPR